jgi:hypothetical protein
MSNKPPENYWQDWDMERGYSNVRIYLDQHFYCDGTGCWMARALWWDDHEVDVQIDADGDRPHRSANAALRHAAALLQVPRSQIKIFKHPPRGLWPKAKKNAKVPKPKPKGKKDAKVQAKHEPGRRGGRRT